MPCTPAATETAGSVRRDIELTEAAEEALREGPREAMDADGSGRDILIKAVRQIPKRWWRRQWQC